jgi:hypothetical protein
VKQSYTCTHCEALLNPSVKIILRGQHRKARGLFLFSPQPGNYSVVIPEGMHLERNDRVTFSCPVCGQDLTSVRDPALAEIRMHTASGSKGTVAFSRRFGHHATYFITEESVRAFGEDAEDRSVNFWGVAQGRP